jgi:hypothetical protein
VILLAIACFLALPVGPCFSQQEDAGPGAGILDPLKGYRQRWSAIQTVSFFTTNTVRMTGAALDPMEAPRSIFMEGKIDRPHERSKINIYLDFGRLKYVSQLRHDPETTHTLQRSLLILGDSWMPLEHDTPTTSPESPARLILDMLLLPNPGQEWEPLDEPELAEYAVNGSTRRATFQTYINKEKTVAVSLSIDGRAIRRVRLFTRNGVLRSTADVQLFSDEGEIGLIPSRVFHRQYRADGAPFRELSGVIDARINEPRFNYLFE